MTYVVKNDGKFNKDRLKSELYIRILEEKECYLIRK